MSHRFVRCPHCKMPHDAAEHVCPNTGLRMPTEASQRAHSREGQRVRSTMMSEIPPAERRPEPLGFDAQRDRVNERQPGHAGGAEATVGTMPPTRDLQRELLGQTISNRYRIKGVLGEGGMGTVYDAEHLGLSRQVAIKVLSQSQAKKKVAVKRFQQEARAAGAIGHPNICEVYDLGLLDDGSPYLVMEKLIGQTLAERIAKEGGLPFDEVVEVLVQVLSGLIAAHDKGIIHRDIKPENIFLARRLGCPPIIKLLDFGVSKMMPEFQTGEDHLDLTRTGMVMGTPYYMSPEQARGERNLDGRVDVYACGVVMYEAIAGKRPFLAPNYNALLLAIINTTPRPLRDFRPKTPPELESIIAKAMARNRDDRYPTAKHFLRELAPPTPMADGSGRLPAPPTAEERKRAPILGGRSAPAVTPRHETGRSSGGGGRNSERHTGASAPSTDQLAHTDAGSRRAMQNVPPAAPSSVRPPPYHEPIDRPDGPSATLKSRMAESRGRPHDHATRLDVPRHKVEQARREALLPPVRGRDEVSEEIDIPIHVEGEGEGEGEDVEEPTEIFRPGMHPMPRPGGAPLSARSAPQTPQLRRSRKSSIPPPAAAAASASDDWEGETVVKRPEFDPAPPQAARRRDAKPFNPDETVKLANTDDIEILKQLRNNAPPRRR